MTIGKRLRRRPSPRRGLWGWLVLVGVVGLVIIALIPGGQAVTPNSSTAPTEAAFTLQPSAITQALLAQTGTAAPTITPVSTLVQPPLSTSVSNIAVTELPTTRYYVQTTANARTCPDTDCDLLGVLEAGEFVNVDGTVDGSRIQSSNLWYRIQYRGQAAYVHTSLLVEAASLTQTQSQGGQPPLSVLPSMTPLPNRGWDCSGDFYSCESFSSRAEMNAYWNACPGDPSRLDDNDDGEFCESN